MKRPSFQFYPADWLRDTALRTCSGGARSLWIDMICYMHEGTPYGHLKVGEKVILPSHLSRMVGEDLGVVEGWLDELSTAGVYEKNTEGVIYSRRMVRDEEIRRSRGEGGKKGGNPNLLPNLKDNLQDNLNDNLYCKTKDNQKPTPSSSSSSSSSLLKEKQEKENRPDPVNNFSVAPPPDVVFLKKPPEPQNQPPEGKPPYPQPPPPPAKPQATAPPPQLPQPPLGNPRPLVAPTLATEHEMRDFVALMQKHHAPTIVVNNRVKQLVAQATEEQWVKVAEAMGKATGIKEPTAYLIGIFEKTLNPTPKAEGVQNVKP